MADQTRHVSTRCPNIAKHGEYEIVDGRLVRTFPIPCGDCYSVESVRIPWEEPGVKPLRTELREEWGVRYEREATKYREVETREVPVPNGGEVGARHMIRFGFPMDGTGRRLVKRVVSDWEEVD